MYNLVRSGTDIDRWGGMISTLLGGIVLLVGLRRRSLGGTVIALIGGWLCYRGISWYSPLNRSLGLRTASNNERHSDRVSTDVTEVERCITIRESADELYRFWREPQHFAHVMEYFAEVTPLDEDHHHWIVPLPLGQLEWETRIVEERPGEYLHWESLANSGVPHEGSVHFRSAPGSRGTEVMLQFRFDPPDGLLGDVAVTLLDRGPNMVANTALRRFKSLVETGEIPTLERNPSARGSGDVI